MTTDDATEPGTVSWRELHAEASSRFRAAGVAEPEISARRIVEECSGHEGAMFAIGLDELVTQRGMAAFDQRVARRLQGEPLQYVIGHWGFRQLDLFIDRRVLIPRPETEVVAGLALDELARLRCSASPLTVVDLGTGSGAIGLSIAMEARNVEVWLTDVSSDALAVARANLAGLGRAGAKVRLGHGSWFDAVPTEFAGTLAVVVSNPPYVAEDEPLPSSVADWEPASALLAPEHGLADLRLLVNQAPGWLRADGALVLEMAPHQTEVIAAEAEESFCEVEIRPDLTGTPRAVVARRRF
jgi:release factor glutamine methyltransferase